MHPEEIKARLRMSGYTLTRVADEMGCWPSGVTNVVIGVSTSERIQRRIAEILKIPVEQIWPPKKINLRRTRAQIEADRARGAAGAAA